MNKQLIPAEANPLVVTLPTLPPLLSGLAKTIAGLKRSQLRYGHAEWTLTGVQEWDQEAKSKAITQAWGTQGRLSKFCRPSTRAEAAAVLGELSLRYFRQADLTPGQIKVLYAGYAADLQDIPAPLWPLMGRRYRNTPGKNFFPQAWELREMVGPELRDIALKRQQCIDVIEHMEIDHWSGGKPMTAGRLAEIRDEVVTV